MKNIVNRVMFFLIVYAASFSAAALSVGDKIGNFTATDALGESLQLSDYQGQYVVLEWANPGCPFTGKHYDSGNMQLLQNTYKEKGVVWLSVYTESESRLLFSRDGSDLIEWSQENEGAASRIIMDIGGDLAQIFGARTTPHMFLISPDQTLLYSGAIDNRRGTDVSEIEGARNYISLALDSSLSGKSIETKTTKPYGCSVKY